MVEVDVASLRSLIKYLEILVGTYPKPLTQTELAEMSQVTKSAISKIKHRLLSLCNMRVLAFRRKMVLKVDSETFWKLFWAFTFESKFRKFMRSEYVARVIADFQIHDKLAKGLEHFSYDKYLSKEDTDWMISIVLRNIYSYEIPSEIFRKTNYIWKKEKEYSLIQLIPFFHWFSNIFSKFDICVFENKDELTRTNKLRDKLYFLIKDNIKTLLMKWEVIKNIKDPERKIQFVRVYEETITYYLDNFFSTASQQIRERAKEKGIPFIKDYEKMGMFASPN